jgi:DNA-binding CsgD family transcriptional regulator
VQVSGRYDQSPHEQLSDREFQVLRMIASGKPTRQIAAELTLSAKTVNTYRARILEKMRMKSTAELTAYVVRQNLAE